MTRTGLRSALSGFLVTALMACGSVPLERDDALEIRGSDTMLILNRRLAEAFMRSHPGVSVVVAGGGTSIGVEALLSGEVSVCAGSRPLTPDEVQRLYEANGTLGLRFLIARDPLSVWVHESNPVEGLSVDELAGVFSGAVTNWSSVGGEDREITVVVRSPASGTHRFFRDRVLRGGAYSGRARSAAGTMDVIRTVVANPGAIGYGGSAYRSESVRACVVEGSFPSARAVGEGRYPLTRHLVYYTVAPPRGLAKDFIDWCQGPEGQAVVREVGYLPLWDRR